jgi:hypothetical protein
VYLLTIITTDICTTLKEETAKMKAEVAELEEQLRALEDAKTNKDCINAKASLAAMMAKCDIVINAHSQPGNKADAKGAQGAAAATRETFDPVVASYDARVAATPVLGAAAHMQWSMPVDFEYDHCVSDQAGTSCLSNRCNSIMQLILA